MNIAICDDEQTELNQIIDCLTSYDATLSYTTFASAKDLYAAYQSGYFDIVLLDIEMTYPNGYEIAKKLKGLKDPPLVIFVTKSSDYTIRGYEVAFRYLKKPISEKSFAHVMDAALSEICPKQISIVDSGKTVVISIQDILYIEAFNYKISIHTLTQIYQMRCSLKSILDELQPCNFVRPHNSYLVHMPYIQSATTKVVTMQNGTEIPISRNRRNEFEEVFRRYLRG